MENKDPLSESNLAAKVPVPPRQWKVVFANEVTQKAKELAQQGNPQGIVTLDHYRQAARIAAANSVHDPSQ